MDGNKRLTQEEEIISFLETEGFIEMTEEEAKKHAPGYLWELTDDSEFPGYYTENNTQGERRQTETTITI